MALASQYNNFLATSNPTALSQDASLHYVTTLVTVKGAGAINKHFSALAQQLRKKREDVLSSIENGNNLFQEVDTTLDFVSTGGSYLPNLDDNLVSGQLVTLPILHVVQFDGNGRIEQIRLYWDQASLLKALGVIGARGGSWPITNTDAQVKLVRGSVKSMNKGTLEATTRQMEDVTITSRPTKKRDPSVDLFSAQVDREEASDRPAPKGALKPHDRPLNEIFVSQDSNQSTPIAKRSESPSKVVAPKIGAGKNYHGNRLFEADDDELSGSPAKGVAPKIGAGKNYHENRLFDEPDDNDQEDMHGSPSEKSERSYMKPHPQKYTHFDLSEGQDETPQASHSRTKTQHLSQWDFSDFVTPAKPARTRGQSQGAHHFSFADPTLDNSPVKGIVHQSKPRRDAESHIELQDDGGDADATRGRNAQARGPNRGHNRNESSLWQNQRDEEPHEEELAATQASIHNPVNQKGRNKDFGSHWQMSDDESGEKEVEEGDQKPLAAITSMKNRHKDFDAHWAVDDVEKAEDGEKGDLNPRSVGGLSLNKDKALKTMSAQWENSDTSPVGTPGTTEGRIMHGAESGKESGINIGGDGMGGRKGQARQWGFGDEDDENANPQTRPAAGRRAGARGAGQRTEGVWEF